MSNAPKPQLRAGHAIIKTLRLSLCGSDVRHIHYLPVDRYPTQAGETGHEMVGVIEAIDPAHSGFQVGQRVLCLAPDHRAMSEFYLAPIKHLLSLDPATPLEHSVQAQQFGTVLYRFAEFCPICMAKRSLSSVRVPLVSGSTSSCNSAAQQRSSPSISRTIRLRFSQHFGAKHTIHNADLSPASTREALREINDGELPDVVIEAAGEEAAIRLAIEIAPQDGFVLIFGVPRFETMDFPIFECFWKSLTLKSRVGTINDPGHACTRQALDYINSGEVDTARMITHTFNFEDVLEAYELHHLQDEGAVKIVIDMEG